MLGEIRATMPRSRSAMRPSSRDEDVAGMRIGVEEAVDQDLLEVRAEELVGEAARRRGPSGERRERVTFAPAT